VARLSFSSSAMCAAARTRTVICFGRHCEVLGQNVFGEFGLGTTNGPEVCSAAPEAACFPRVFGGRAAAVISLEPTLLRNRSPLRALFRTRPRVGNTGPAHGAVDRLVRRFGERTPHSTTLANDPPPLTARTHIRLHVPGGTRTAERASAAAPAGRTFHAVVAHCPHSLAHVPRWTKKRSLAASTAELGGATGSADTLRTRRSP
jgi:hypothetical protein